MEQIFLVNARVVEKYIITRKLQALTIQVLELIIGVKDNDDGRTTKDFDQSLN